MQKTICVFGASTTWGAWDSEKGGWVNRLRLSLEKEKYDTDVYNLGVSGDNSRNLLKRFEPECRAREPTMIIISIGDNDSAKNSPVYVPITEFKSSLIELIKISTKFTNNLLILGTKNVDETKTQPVPWDTSVYYSNKNLIEYDKEIEKICTKERVNFLKLSGLLKKEDFEDGIHPNSKGHEKIFRVVKDYLVKKRLVVK
ncbi:MAG: GDSL-type esterase/lipase family protein [Candidatus Pacearchaeota archaeon]|jgi:lysophospholipase L1-like esterase